MKPTDDASQFPENGMSATPRTDDKPRQATPFADLRQQIMDSRVPKNEREWWAQRTIEKLETELAAEKAECNLNRTRIASLFWSGALDKYTGGDVQRWAEEYTSERARLRAEVKRLNGCCEELHTLIDNHGYPSGIDYAEMTARAEKAEADTARMDWLEKEALEDWGMRSINRAAIDAAMKEANQ